MTHINDYIDLVAHDERVRLSPSTRAELINKVKIYIGQLIIKEKEQQHENK
jgi:hypothetical protein